MELPDISPLAGLTKLEFVVLEDLNLADLSPLAGMTRMWNLAISQNRIRDLSPLSGMTGLVWLRAVDNQSPGWAARRRTSRPRKS